MASRRPSLAIVLLMLGSTGAFLALAALGWGGVGSFLEHPARALTCALVVIVTTVAMFAGVGLLSPNRAKWPGLWLLWPAAIYSLVLAFLPAYCDRVGLWVLDGDAMRYAGLVILAVGCFLRVGPMFQLRSRFTWPLATHEEHRLVTTGFYRYVRNPSYLGAILGLVGWVLVFRSGIGLVLSLLIVPLFMAILPKEEALLRAELGAEYDEYCKRTWRLIPFVY